MSSHRQNIESLVNLPITCSRPLLEWNEVLNFFERHKEELDIFEVRMLAEKSEEYRKHCNKDVTEVQTVYKNGKNIEVTITKAGMGIDKLEVNPNLQNHLNRLELQERQKKISRIEAIPHNKESTPLPLVAMASQ